MNIKILRLLFPVFLFGSFFLLSDLVFRSEEFTMNDYIQWKIEKKKNKKPTYGMPDEAMKWYYEQRAFPQGFIPEGWRDKALTEIEQKNQVE